jgi:hypothetical protein
VTPRIAVALVAAAVMLLPHPAVRAGDPSHTASDREAIQHLLDRRAEAILDRDESAFLETLDSETGDFFAEQKRMFESMKTVPLGSYELHARWDRYGDLARPSDRYYYARAEDVAIPVTEEAYEIEGFDERPALEDMFFTFVKRDGEWLIAEDSDLNDMAFYSARHLWDYGPLYRVDTGRFVIFGHECTVEGQENLCPDEARDFAGLADQALDRVDLYWTKPWSHRVAVLVPTTPDELKRILQITFDPADFVAFAYSTVDTDEGIRFTGHRIIFNWRSLRDRTDSNVVTILAHELVHVASRDVSGPFIPVFLDEGIAEYIGHDADPDSLAFLNAEIANGVFDRKLPEDFEFITGDGTSIFRSYQEGQSAVRYFVERYGMDKFIRLYRALGTPLAAGTARYHMDRALRRITGSDFETFQSAWADSIS